MNTPKNRAATVAPSTEYHRVPGGRRRCLFVLMGLAVLALTLVMLSAETRTVNAQGGNPPNQPRRGLIYDGLTRSERAKCKNGFDVNLGTGKRPLCTHGPDPVPSPLVGEGSVPPSASAPAASQVACDGDGVSGKRFQVLYVRATDTPDQYATYLSSIQDWVAGADSVLNDSAAETGGTRHFRFVQDTNCIPDVQNVTVSATGDDTFGNLISELQNLGYSRIDRNYVLFVDAQIYCGIATIAFDDSPWDTNSHNTGSYYARVDARCWSARTAAHEMMHNLGGVQMSAPHSTSNWHCTDESDVMCYKDTSTTVLQYLCDLTQEVFFDCNKDDYFNTNPPDGSYLASHWNTANNDFLIYPRPELSIQSTATGKQDRKGNFMETDSFKRRDTVLYRTFVQDARGKLVGSARVKVNVNQPDGTAVCNFTGTSDSAGMVEGSCAIPKNAVVGNWQVQIASAELPGTEYKPNGKAAHDFHVAK